MEVALLCGVRAKQDLIVLMQLLWLLGTGYLTQAGKKL